MKIACLLCAAMLPVWVQAQFTFTTNADNTLTLTGYTGTNPVVTIPDTTNGLMLTSIGDYALILCPIPTNVTIPNSVTSIGSMAFQGCGNLTSVTIPNSVTSIGSMTFVNCISLASAAIGNSVTSIGDLAFYKCISLTGVYFRGNAPIVDSNAFAGDDKATVYYLAGTTGWGPTFAGRPTKLYSRSSTPAK